MKKQKLTISTIIAILILITTGCGLKSDNFTTEEFLNCKSDINCFSQRAKTCKKTKFLHIHSEEPEETPGVITNLKTNYEITGLENNKCNFFHGMMVIEINATEEGKQFIMTSEGKTKTEVENELKTRNEDFYNSTQIGATLHCKAKSGDDIIDHINKIFKGEQKISITNEKTTYGDNITCIEKY